MPEISLRKLLKSQATIEVCLGSPVPDRRALPSCGPLALTGRGLKKLQKSKSFPELTDCYWVYATRLMFSLYILFWSVVRFSPRRSAAPPWPAILPETAFKAWMMTCRSACSKVDAAEAAESPQLCTWDIQFVSLRENHASLDEVFQLANVTSANRHSPAPPSPASERT